MKFSKRQSEIMDLVPYGFSAKQIADKLYIEQTTVEWHLKIIKKKTQAKNIADLTRIYIVTNPKKFLIAILFLMVQTIAVIGSQDSQERMFRSSRRNRREKIVLMG